MSPRSLHPHQEVFSEQYRQGKISRREFMRLSSLVGVSLGAASLALPWETAWAQASTPQRGGMLKVASVIHKLSNPAQISWGKTANILRQVAEYLTVTGPDNITRPFFFKDL